MESSHGKPTLPSGIYGITAEKFSAGRSNLEVVQRMIEGGIRVIQYREKRAHKSAAQMLAECQAIRWMTREAGVLFIVNDYVDIALLVRLPIRADHLSSETQIRNFVNNLKLLLGGVLSNYIWAEITQDEELDRFLNPLDWSSAFIAEVRRREDYQ